jgi:hypothetical protein
MKTMLTYRQQLYLLIDIGHGSRDGWYLVADSDGKKMWIPVSDCY